jgi:hypothetical protein
MLLVCDVLARSVVLALLAAALWPTVLLHTLRLFDELPFQVNYYFCNWDDIYMLAAWYFIIG